MSDSFDRSGKITLFNNAITKKSGGNPKMPDLSGSLYAHRDIKQGEEIRVALWRARDDAGNIKKTSKGNDYLTGQISDPMQMSSGYASSNDEEGDLFGEDSNDSGNKESIDTKELITADDEIPF